MTNLKYAMTLTCVDCTNGKTFIRVEKAKRNTCESAGIQNARINQKNESTTGKCMPTCVGPSQKGPKSSTASSKVTSWGSSVVSSMATHACGGARTILLRKGLVGSMRPV